MSVRVEAVVVLTWLAILASPGPAGAQSVELSISPTSVTFPSADPDITPVVSAPALFATYRIRGAGTQAWRLTVLANGDLIAGPSTVDISNVSWTATPSPPFQGGWLSKTVEQLVAAGTGNVPQPSTGWIVFQLANSWTYTAGTYTQTLTFTLSVP